MPKNKKPPFNNFFRSPGILIFTAIFAGIGTFFILKTVAYNEGGNAVTLKATSLNQSRGSVVLSWSSSFNSNLRYCNPSTSLQKIGTNTSSTSNSEWAVVGNNPKALNGTDKVYFFAGTKGYYHTYALICYDSHNIPAAISNSVTVPWN